MSDTTPPEMQRLELSGAVLQLKALGIDDVLHFSFPSPPSAQRLAAAYELLHALGAVDNSGALSQPLGLNMAEFPLSPLHSKALLASGKVAIWYLCCYNNKCFCIYLLFYFNKSIWRKLEQSSFPLKEQVIPSNRMKSAVGLFVKSIHLVGFFTSFK